MLQNQRPFGGVGVSSHAAECVFLAKSAAAMVNDFFIEQPPQTEANETPRHDVTALRPCILRGLSLLSVAKSCRELDTNYYIQNGSALPSGRGKAAAPPDATATVTAVVTAIVVEQPQLSDTDEMPEREACFILPSQNTRGCSRSDYSCDQCKTQYLSPPQSSHGSAT